MARTNATNFSGGLQFPYATAGTDLFKKEDVQTLALAVDGHDHSTGKGLPLVAGSIPSGTITSAMIANGTIVAADIATGTITSNEIADGTIATADLANASVTNAKLASDTARANQLTNGGFEVWQRGNGPYTATGVYTADRWLLTLVGSDTLSVSRNTANVDTSLGSNYCAACTFTLGSGGGATSLSQPLKTGDANQLASRQVSASVRVSTGTASAVRIGVHDGTSWTYSSFHTGTGTYQTLTATATIGGASTAQVGVFFAGSCTAYLDNAMLVVGSQPADYAPLPPADDLARCLRYYEIVGGAGGSDIMIRGWAGGAGQNIDQSFRFRVTKPITPTMTKVGGWTNANTSGLAMPSFTADAVRVEITSTTTGDTWTLNSPGGSWLTAEANP